MAGLIKSLQLFTLYTCNLAMTASEDTHTSTYSYQILPLLLALKIFPEFLSVA